MPDSESGPPSSPGAPAAGGPVRRATLAVLGAVLLCACRDPTAGPGRLSGALPPLPTYRAVRASGPMTVDGRLDEPTWARAERAELVESLGGAPPRYGTEVMLAWDAVALYVAFRCQDDEVWARPGRAADDPIYEDEVVELFLDPSGRGRDYVELEVSPANVTFDARFAAPRSDLARARAWSAGARSAVVIDGALTVGSAPPAPARGFTVELAVPWAALGLEPRPGARWRMNLYRLETHNRRRLVEGSAWSAPLRPDFHAVDRFGWIELAAEADVRGPR